MNKITLLTLILISFSSIAEDFNTLCMKSEIQYFSCKIKNSDKIVSICGNIDFDKISYDDENAYLQYRFGTKKVIDFLYPKIKKKSLLKFFSQDLHGYHHDAEILMFKSSGYEYNIESSMSIQGEFEDGDDRSYNEFHGITIYKNGKVVGSKSCDYSPFKDTRKKDEDTFGKFRQIISTIQDVKGNSSD